MLVIAFVVPPPALFPTLIVGTVAAGVVPPTHSWWNRNTDPGGSPADAGR
ncbi:hypothetical protein ACFQX6_54320 [Streptosporangium lutulentum]